MKKTGSKLITSALAIVFAVVSFLGLAFNFVVYTVTGGLGNTSRSTTENWSLSQWFDFFKDNSSDKIGTWNFAKVLMIITLVVVAIVAVLALVQLFVDNKLVRLGTSVASIVCMALSVLFIIMFIVGGAVYASSVSGSGDFVSLTTTMAPNAGPIILALGGILAGVCGLLSNLGKKKKR